MVILDTLIVPFQRAYKYASNEPLRIQRWRIILHWTKNLFTEPVKNRIIFLTAIWLPHGQLWAIIDRTASLTWGFNQEPCDSYYNALTH